jgi:hypothetical protein
MKWLIGLAMVCGSWLYVNISHDAVKNRELDAQIEMARVIQHFAKPSVQVEPQKEKL